MKVNIDKMLWRLSQAQGEMYPETPVTFGELKEILEAGIEPDEPNKKFTPPTLFDIETYCLNRKNGVNSQKFFNFYTSKGWMVGKNKMKDWKAAVRNWENSGSENNYRASDTNNEEGRL